MTPDPEAAIVPTIVCRVLVDPEGQVQDVRLYEPPRRGYSQFEGAALEAVKAYRFSPAVKQGMRVPVWVLWTIDFAPGHAAKPSSSSLPIRFDGTLM